MDYTDIEKIVGMSVKEARNFLHESLDMTLRVTFQDGDYALVTQDYRLDRVNVAVRDKKVVSWRIG